MLIRFLITNLFPASCFYAPFGPIASYRRQNNKLTIFPYDGNARQLGVTNMPFEIIDIPKKLFRTYIKTYRTIIKQLESKSLLDLINNPPQKGTNWEAQLLNEVVSNLADNLVLSVSLQGTITTNNANRHYNLQMGEGVYILSTTSGGYQIKTVDGQTMKVKREDIQISTISQNKTNIKKWEKILDTIEKEYEQFVKENT